MAKLHFSFWWILAFIVELSDKEISQQVFLDAPPQSGSSRDVVGDCRETSEILGFTKRVLGILSPNPLKRAELSVVGTH